MCREGRCPAIVAGLMGVAMGSAPSLALAASAQSDLAFLSPESTLGFVVQFGLGVVVGASAAAGTSAVILHRMLARQAEGEVARRAPVRATQPEPRTGDARPSEQAAPVIAKPAPAPVSDHVAASDDAGEGDDLPRGKHFRRAGQGQGVAAAHAAEGPEEPEEPEEPCRAAARRDAERSEVDEEAWNAFMSGPAHVATDYTQVAENYVRRASFAERMAQRARGVREVLSERLGGDRFEGLPVIERADGSVGDVGTGWWNARMGDSVRLVGVQDTARRGGTDAQPSDDDPLPSVPSWMGRGASRKAAPPTPSRAARIAHSVAEVDQGAYPEQRSARELDDDIWEQALKAMGERIDQIASVPVAAVAPLPSFGDAIGGTETIDEPEGLENPTSFIPFRAPAGHPEVVDTETYVDYLLDQEFSQNSSESARASSRNYLKVIEGGSQELRSTGKLRGRSARPHAQERASAHAPRHLAPALAANEA
ncbi:hypothetical protein HMPREF1008_01705 [Olsenella sp. oral taxon 809 str. F0356]|nr:hypothetical protein HMPREF1008_01705 [Olsenella sp. oral taxon 809 str. F0356]